MSEQLHLLPGYLSAHLGLTLVALLVGVLVSVPLGVLVSRARRLETPVLGVASVIQTVPSLALLAFMVPLLAALGAQSIGYLPAVIGLCLYSVLPILRNTVAGLHAVDPALIEAARGVGMTGRQQLLRVELPLALPLVIAGVRTSAVWTVGTATLATPVGAPSLGSYIFSGLQTRNYAAVLVGCVASAGLALLLDGLVHLLQIGLTRRRPVLCWICACAFALLAAAPIGMAVRGGGEARPVLIGAKTFTEQYILARVLSGRVASTGQAVRVLDSLGSTVVFDALRAGQIDAYVDYTGTLWATVLHRGEVPRDRAQVLTEVRRSLRLQGIEIAAVLGFENTYALAMRRAEAERLGVVRISDLAPHAPRLEVGGDYEIFGRPEWRAIEHTYGLSFLRQRAMDPALLYEAARGDAVGVISAFSTDGRVLSYDLKLLVDDRQAIPPYDAVVLVGPRLVREHPEVVAALHRLEGAIDGERMRRLNVAVDEKGQSPEQVARGFLAAP